MNAFCLAVVHEYVSLVISRQVLTDVSNRLLLLPDEVSMAISHYTLDKVNFVIIYINWNIMRSCLLMF